MINRSRSEKNEQAESRGGSWQPATAALIFLREGRVRVPDQVQSIAGEEVCTGAGAKVAARQTWRERDMARIVGPCHRTFLRA